MIEPLTALTDILLALMCFLFAHDTYRDYSYHKYEDRTWFWFFLFTGLAFLLGAMYHGMELFSVAMVWLFVMVCFGIALIFFMIGESKIAFSRKTIYILRFIYSVVFIAAALASYLLKNFRIMLIVLSLGLLSVIIMNMASRTTKRATRLLVGGVVVAVLASVIQSTGLELFGMNHNVMFHLGIMLGLLMIFYSYRMTVK